MAPIKNSVEVPAKALVNGDSSKIPDWLTEDYFVDILKDNITGFKKIQKFEVTPTGGDGENYASVMLRINITAELLYGSTKDVGYMLKTVPQSEQAKMMIRMMGLFPKETTMYSKYIPEFEQMYQEVGKQITFGPKCYRFKEDPGVDYILLEDLSPLGFKNANRLEGLDQEHAESVLRLLAAFHAVSAVRLETQTEDDPILSQPFFSEDKRELLTTMTNSLKEIMVECLNTYATGKKYVERMKNLLDMSIDKYITQHKMEPDEFKVLLHGDIWVNNIMFRYNDEGKREETIFVDFQISRYGTPAMDLYYFLLSSTNLDLKVSQFDYFVKYYHEQLVQNLKLLHYSKKIPTLKELRMDLLRRSFSAFSTITGVMSAVLLDPNKNANIDNFMETGGDGAEFKKKLYTNPRYVKHMELLLPWLDMRGILD